jgi:hypothetical protein
VWRHGAPAYAERLIWPFPVRFLASLLLLLGGICGVAGAADLPVMTPPVARAVDRDGRLPVPVFTAPNHCAWPNLKLLADGRTLAALIYNGSSHGHDPGDVECWLSSDGGAIWRLGSAVTQHEPGTVRGGNYAVGLASNGDLLVLTGGVLAEYQVGIPPPPAKFRHRELGAWQSRSPDGGRSWWVDKQAFPQSTPVDGPAIPFGNIETAQNGDLCVSAYSVNGPWAAYADRKFRSYFYRSKDDGKTWGEPVVLGPDANESTVIHLGHGRWLGAVRNGPGTGGRNFLNLCVSVDDGRTWNDRGPITGLQRIPGNFLKLRDGRVLFCYGERQSAPGHRGVEAMLSADGGETWSKPVRIVDWNGLDGGYPSSVQRGDGEIVTAYYSSALAGDPADSRKNYHMGVVAWNLDRTFSQR